MRALVAILACVVFHAVSASAEIENVSAVGRVVRYSMIDNEKSLVSFVEFERSRRSVFEIEVPDADGNYYIRPMKGVVEVNARQLEQLLAGNYATVYVVYRPTAYTVSNTCQGQHLVEQVPQLKDDGKFTIEAGCIVIHPTRIIIEPIL